MPKMRITQRYATGSGAILSLPSTARFEIFGVWRMQCEVESEPEDFRISNEPNAEQDRHEDHRCERDCGIANAEYVIQERPGAERGYHREAIADGDVREKVS